LPAPVTELRGLAGVLLLACAAFAPALVGGFAYDDSEAILHNPVVQGKLPASAAFGQDYWHHFADAGHYRPLATLTLRWDAGLWGTDGRGFHATTLGLHLCVVLLMGLLLRRVLPESRSAILGLAFFACHPALADSVAWISGRTSSLCAIGGLVGLLLMLGRTDARASEKRVALGAALAPFLACLGKEEGLVFVPFAILLGHWYGRGRAAWMGALAGLALAAGLRALALGSAIPAAHGAPLGDLPLFERVLTGGLAWIGGLGLVALPWKFPPGQGNLQAHSLGPAGPWLAGLFLLSCLALAALAWHRRRHSPIRAGSLLLVLVSILPTLEIIPAGEVFAPRYLYLPLLLAAPLTGALLAQVPRKVLAVLLLLWIPLGWQASQPYTSRAAYWKARMEFGEETPMGWNALGNAHLEKQQSGLARRAFEHAIELDPSYSRPWVNLGTLTWTELGPEAAHPILERACKEGPNNPAAHANLGALLLKLQQPNEAERHYTRAIELAPGRGAHWRGLGRALLDQGRRGEARTALETALQKLGQDPACETLLRRIQEG